MSCCLVLSLSLSLSLALLKGGTDPMIPLNRSHTSSRPSGCGSSSRQVNQTYLSTCAACYPQYSQSLPLSQASSATPTSTTTRNVRCVTLSHARSSNRVLDSLLLSSPGFFLAHRLLARHAPQVVTSSDSSLPCRLAAGILTCIAASQLGPGFWIRFTGTQLFWPVQLLCNAQY
eukprot:1242918-Rhodomonas_salina.2